jgi:hypothetical protein
MRQMLKLFCRLAILTGTVGAAAAIFVISWPPPNSAGFYAAILDKERMLREIPSPRIILVGGSNLPFGIDSELLSKTFQRPVINMGVHAGIGLKLMLAQVKPYIHAGDWIVLVPEYEHFFRQNFEGDDAVLAGVLEIDKKTLFLLDIQQLLRLPNIAKYLIRYRYERLTNTTQFQPEFYARAAFNRYGDVTWHFDKQPIRPVSGGIYLWDYDQLRNPVVIPALNDFRRFVTAQDASVVMIYPDTMASLYDKTALDIQKVSSDLSAHLDIPVLGTPADFRMDDQYFFDTIYHLTREGRDVRMKRFTELLQAHFSSQNSDNKAP